MLSPRLDSLLRLGTTRLKNLRRVAIDKEMKMPNIYRIIIVSRLVEYNVNDLIIMTHISGGAQNVDLIKLDSLFELSLQEINS